MESGRLKKILRLLAGGTLGLFMGAQASHAAPVADHFAFMNPPSLLPGSYNVDLAVTFRVVALDSGGATVTSFTGPVTAGLFDAVDPSLVADPKAIITNLADSSSNTGTATLNFLNGQLDVQVVFKTGYTGENFMVKHPTITTGNSRGPYTVTGFTTGYYFKDANNATPPAASSPWDQLNIDPTVATGSDVIIDIPFSANGIGSDSAAIYVISSVTGQFAAGSADISAAIFTRGSGSPGIKYEIILDYNGDLNGNPNNYFQYDANDTVYTSSQTNPGSPASFGQIGQQPALLSGTAAVSQAGGMVNGQVIFRIWKTNNAGTAQLRIRTANPANACAINIPYSNLNVSPVRGTLTPKQVLAGAPVTMNYDINNLSGQAVTQTRFNLPKGGSVNPWTLLGTPGTGARTGTVVTRSNPTLVADGYVDINWTTPLAVNEVASVAMTFTTAADVAQTNWDFGFTTIKNSAGVTVAADSAGALDIQTLGAPSAPSSFLAVPANYTTSGGQVSLSWEQITNQSTNGYIITRNPTGASFPQTIGANTTTTYSDASAVNLTPYTYQIVAKNTVAQSSSFGSNPVTAFADPGPPTSVTALSAGTSIHLTWTAPVSVSGSYILGGYNLYRGTTTGTETLLTTLGTVLTYDDTTVSGGVTYFYKIASVDNQPVTGAPGTGSHISGYSSEVSGFPPGNPPTSPAAVLTSSSPATIQFTWTAPVSNLNAPVNYVIQRGTNTNPSSTYAFVSAPPAPFNDFTGLVSGNFYVYRVAAVNSLGVTTNFSAPVTGRVGPSAPTGLSASPQAPSGSAITLTWSANPAPENVVKYNLYRDGTPIATPATPVAVVSSGLVQGVNYTYTIEGVDNAGVTGPLSTPVVSAMLPLAPQSLTAVYDPLVTNNVDLTWATPTSGANVTGYNVYRNTTNVFPGLPGKVAAGLAASPYTDVTSLSAGTTYFYYLQAQDPGGAGVTTSKGLQIPPSPPVNLTAFSTSGSVSIVWDANLAAEHVSSYKVYRVDPSGPTTVTTTVSSPTTVFNDATVVAGKSYDYFVTATNPGGGAGILGGESLHSGSITSGKAPQAPTNFSVSSIATNNDISLGWTDVTVVDSNATSLTLYVNTAAVTTGATLVQLTPPTTATYTDISNLPDTTYYYWLRTNNAYGSGPVTGFISKLTYPAPVTITSLSLDVDGVSRDAVWSTSSSAVTYNIYRAQGASAFVKVQSIPASALSFPTPYVLSLPVQAGQPYSYRVTAENATGEGPYGNTFTINIPPAAPAGLTAVSGISNISTEVDLSWQAVIGQGVTGYKIYRSPDNVLGNYVLINSTASTSYPDLGLSGGVTYYYRVTSNNGLETTLALANPVSLAAYALPNAPGPVTATSGNAQVALAWGATGLQTTYPIAGYDIYQSTSSGVTGVKVNATPVPSASYNAAGLTNAAPYYYLLQAVDTQGHAGIFSNPQVSEIPVVPPGVPGGVTSANGDQAVQITWSASVQGTLSVGSYIIRKVAPGPVTTFIPVAGNMTGYVDIGLTNGQNYSYSVEAVDSSGVTLGAHVSGFSGSVTGVPGLFVNPPGLVQAVAGIGAVTITWTDSFTGLGTPVDRYDLLRRIGSSGSFSTIASSITTGVQTYTDTPLTNGSTYYYYFIAYAGASPSSNSATVTAIPGGPPAAPAGLTASDGVSQVTLNWTANNPVDNIPVSIYKVHRDDGAGGSFSVIGTTNHPVVTYSDTPLTAGVTFLYYLTAVNNNNTEGSASATVSAYPYNVGPPVGVTSSSTNSAVTVIWSAPTTPASSFPVTAYVVYRGITSNPNIPVTVIAVAGNPTTFIDTTVTVGQLYYYRVAANDDKGHIGPMSTQILDGASNPPSAPATFVANAGDDQILVDWSPVTVAAVGSLPVSQYRLIRNDGGTPVTLLLDQTWYLDTSASNGGPVTYTVEAIDVTGQISTGVHISVPAGPVSATAANTNVNPPTGLTATPLTNTSIHLDWTPANDQGRVIAHYVITRATSFSGTYGTPITVVNNFLSPPASYDVTGLSPNTTYYFVMRSYDTTNNLVSAPSNHAWAATPAGSGGALSPSGDMLLDHNLFRPLLGETLLIKYLVPTGGTVEIKIYTVSGQPIMTLPPGSAVAGVEGNALWDGKDKNSFTAASGLYLVEIKVGSFHQVKKVAVIK